VNQVAVIMVSFGTTATTSEPSLCTEFLYEN
jgi:hypothetical protein